jgi:hypothetical protein
VTAVGGALRVWSPGRIGLWRDEVQFINISRLPNLAAIWKFLYAHESHPPLFYFVAHGIGQLGGSAIAAMSQLVLVASIGLIPAAWWLASLSCQKGAGLTAAALVACSAPLAFLSVQIRPYSVISLLLLLSVGALIRAHHTRSTQWRAAWAVQIVLLLYLHHVSVVIAAAEVGAILALERPGRGLPSAISSWFPWFIAIGTIAIPDALMLLHQRAMTGYLTAPQPEALLPLRQLVRLGLLLPGEIIFGIGGSVVAACAPWWEGRRSGSGHSSSDAGVIVGCLFLLLFMLLVLASYRQSIMVDHVVLALSPLGQVAGGVAIAHGLAAGRKWMAAFGIECAVVTALLSGLFMIGASKTNTDLVARYIDAEAKPDDMIVLVPGTLGPSFNHYFHRPLSQIDFPMIGVVRAYRFDRGFDRIADPSALSLATDSIAAAREAHRRIWFAYPANLRFGGSTPTILPDSFAIKGRAWRARATQLRGALVAAYGLPTHVASPAIQPWSMEILTLDRFGDGKQ